MLCPADVQRADVAGLFRVERAARKELGHSQDGVERRADLVADVGEELGLRPAGGFRLRLGLLERVQRLLLLGDVVGDANHALGLAVGAEGWSGKAPGGIGPPHRA